MDPVYCARLINFIKSNPAIIKIAGEQNIAAEMSVIVGDAGGNASLMVDYADLLTRCGMHARAQETLHSLIDSDSANYRAQYLLSRSYYMAGSLKEAQYPIIKCLEIRPDYDEGRLLLARIFFKARQYEKARKIFEYYSEHNRFSISARLFIAKCHYYSNGFDAASSYVKTILESGEPSFLFPAIHAYHLSNVEKYDVAFSVIYERLLNRPDRSERSETGAGAYYILDFMNAFLFSFAARGASHDDYLREAAAILDFYKDDRGYISDPLYFLYKNFAAAAYYMKRHDYDEMRKYSDYVAVAFNDYETEELAVFDFEELNNIYKLARHHYNKTSAGRLKSTGCVHINSGNLKSAVLCFEKASSYAPDDIDILFMLGESYLLNDLADKAIEIYERVKKLEPGNLDAFRRVSEIYLGLGLQDKFISECRQILALDPEDIISRFYIAEYMFNNSNLKEAEEFLKYICLKIESNLKTGRLDDYSLELKDIYEKTCFMLAQIAFKDGNKENTIIYLNSVININPENEKAFELLNKLKQNSRDKQIMYSLREAEEKEVQQDFAAAMQLYESIIEVDPQFIDAHFRLAKTLIKQENFERALFELQRIFDYNYESYDKLAEVYLSMALISYELSKIDKCRESLYELSHISKDLSIALMLLYLHKTSFLISGASADFNVLLNELFEKQAGPDDFVNNFSFGYIVNNVPAWVFEDNSIFIKAKAAALKAFEQDPNDIYAAFSCAYAFEKAGEIEEAYEIYARIASFDFKNGAEFKHTIRKYKLLNNPQGLSISFYKFNLLDNLSLINLAAGVLNKVAYYEEMRTNLEDAAHYYSKSAALVEDNPVAAMKAVDLQLNIALADKNTRISRVSAIIKSLKKEASAADSNAALKFKLGYLYFKLPDDLDVLGSTLENVIMELKHSLAVDNKYLPAYAALRVVYQKMGAKDKKMYALALDTLKKAAAHIDEKNPYLNVEIGDCYYYYYAQDYKNDALDYYKKAVMYKADFTEAHFKIASIYRIKKDFEKAVLHYAIAYDLEPNGIYAQECKKSIATLKRRHMIE